jgi:MFS family permease
MNTIDNIPHHLEALSNGSVNSPHRGANDTPDHFSITSKKSRRNLQSKTHLPHAEGPNTSVQGSPLGPLEKPEPAKPPKLHCYEMWLPLIGIGRSFISNIPMLLSVPLQARLGLGANFIQLCFVAWWGSTVLTSVPIGTLFDKFGPNVGHFPLVSMFLGQVLFWLAVDYGADGMLWLIILARVLQGMGGQGIEIGQQYVANNFMSVSKRPTIISLCFWWRSVGSIIANFLIPQAFIWTGSFNTSMGLPLLFIAVGWVCYPVYLHHAKKAKDLEALNYAETENPDIPHSDVEETSKLIQEERNTRTPSRESNRSLENKINNESRDARTRAGQMVHHLEGDLPSRSINRSRDNDPIDQATQYDPLTPAVTLNPDPAAANFFESLLAKLTRFSRAYYLLLIIKTIVFATYSSMMAIFMDYLFTGCGLSYQESVYFVIAITLLGISFLTINGFLSRHYDFVTPLLCVLPMFMAAFLWLSAFLPEKGIWMAVFGTITLSFINGLAIPIVDGFITQIMPKDVAGFGASLSMTTLGLAAMILPAVNGWILGDTATKENLSYCCYFLAVVMSIGVVSTWLLAVEMRRGEQRKLEKD